MGDLRAGTGGSTVAQPTGKRVARHSAEQVTAQPYVGRRVAAKPVRPVVETPVDDGSIHSGVFRANVELVKSDSPNKDDALLQAQPGDVLQSAKISS